MISLPSIEDVPAVLAPGPADVLAAKCALALSAPGPIRRVRTKSAPAEVALLRLQLEARLFSAARQLSIFRPALHAHLGDAAGGCECVAKATEPLTMWLGNANGSSWDSRWTLEHRWQPLERAAPGICQTALYALDEARHQGIPVFLPREALGMAQWTYWMGESDETVVIAERREWGDDEARAGKPLTDVQMLEEYGMLSRASIDKMLPPYTTSPKRALKNEDLERLANGRGAAKEAAARTLGLFAEIAAANRIPKPERFSLHTQYDETWALGYAATLRWTSRDPMARIFDDHANHQFESAQNVSDDWGWLIVPHPARLPAFFAHLEHRFAIARRMEQLIEAIATRTRE